MLYVTIKQLKYHYTILYFNFILSKLNLHGFCILYTINYYININIDSYTLQSHELLEERRPSTSTASVLIFSII